MNLERETYGVSGAGGLMVQHVEVVLVDASGDGLATGIPQAVLQRHLRFTQYQPHGLLIYISVAASVGEFLRVFHGIGGLADRPFSVSGDFVGGELAEGGLVGFSDRAHADLYEALAGFGVLVAQAGAVGEELLHWTHDGVVNLRVVAVEPFAEVFMTLELKTGHGARPVEPRATIVAVLRIRQQQRYLQAAV